jgi:hypothetical protein
MRIHNTDPNYFQITHPGSVQCTVVPSRFCTNGSSRILPSLARDEGHIDKLREVEAGTILLSRLSWIHIVLQHGECVLINCGRSANKFSKSQIRKFAEFNFFRFANLPQMSQFADLPFADHISFVICGFAICGPNLALILKGITSTREVLLRVRTRVYCRLPLTAGLKLRHKMMYHSTAKHSLFKILSGPILLASFFLCPEPILDIERFLCLPRRKGLSRKF